jgi:hypothetical protein
VTKRGLAVLATALLVQAFVLYRAFHYGPMAGLVPWDDCLTIQRGLHNLRILAGAYAPWAMLMSLGDVVIHSPVSDLQAMLGLVVGGGAIWVSYALNVGALLLALYAVLFKAGRPSPCRFLALAIFILVQPVTINSLTFLKADWKGGLLLAAALFTLYEAVDQDRRDLKLFGAGLLGLAIAAKLTAFYMPVFALMVLVAFEALAILARPPTQGIGPYLQSIRPTFTHTVALALGPFWVRSATTNSSPTSPSPSATPGRMGGAPCSGRSSTAPSLLAPEPGATCTGSPSYSWPAPWRYRSEPGRRFIPSPSSSWPDSPWRCLSPWSRPIPPAGSSGPECWAWSWERP